MSEHTRQVIDLVVKVLQPLILISIVWVGGTLTNLDKRFAVLESRMNDLTTRSVPQLSDLDHRVISIEGNRFTNKDGEKLRQWVEAKLDRLETRLRALENK